MPLLVSQPLDTTGAVTSPGDFPEENIFPPVLRPFLTIPGKQQGLTFSTWVLSSLEAQPAAALVLPGNVGFKDAL